MSADRGKYICQSQSLNLFMENPTYQKLTSMLFYSWKKGLKTGMYYLRTRPAADPIKFTVSHTEMGNPNSRKSIPGNENPERFENDDCLICGS